VALRAEEVEDVENQFTCEMWEIEIKLNNLSRDVKCGDTREHSRVARDSLQFFAT
jgi:hypothetical protein